MVTMVTMHCNGDNGENGDNGDNGDNGGNDLQATAASSWSHPWSQTACPLHLGE